MCITIFSIVLLLSCYLFAKDNQLFDKFEMLLQEKRTKK